MNAHHSDHLTEHEALREVNRVSKRSVSQSRWHGSAWLILGFGTFTFLLATPPGRQENANLSLLIALAFGVMAAVLWYVESRLNVIGRVAARIDKPVTSWYIGLFVGAIALKGLLLPDGYTAWLVLVALLPVVPCLVGSWKVFRT